MSMPVLFRPKKPLYPPSKRPYTSPKKAVSSMTIAAGFRCTDGVVLCADTQVTHEGWFKLSASKITTTSQLGHRLFFVHAGDVEAAQSLVQNVGSSFKKYPPRTWEEFEETLYDQAKKNSQRFGRRATSLLIALRSNTVTRLFSVEGTRIVAQSDYKCLGLGLPVAQRVLASYWHKGMFMMEAVFVAICLVREAKDHGYTVGGTTQIVTVPDKGDWGMISSAEIESLESSYIEAQQLLGKLLTRYTPLFESDRDFQSDLDDLTSLLQNAHKRRGHLLSVRAQKEFDALSQQDDEHSDK